MRDFIPSAPAVVREALAVLAGAAIAIAVIRVLPPNWQRFFLLKPIGE
jgi:hypothetical protein